MSDNNQDENFAADDRWAQDVVGSVAMRFLEILWANGNVGVVYPASQPLSKGARKAQELNLVEATRVKGNTLVWRFSKLGAPFAVRYFPKVPQGGRWWVLMAAQHLPPEQREIVVLTDQIARMLVLAEVVHEDARYQLKNSVRSLGASDRVAALLCELFDELWKE